MWTKTTGNHGLKTQLVDPMYLKNQDSNSRVRPKSVISTRKRFEHWSNCKQKYRRTVIPFLIHESATTSHNLLILIWNWLWWLPRKLTICSKAPSGTNEQALPDAYAQGSIILVES